MSDCRCASLRALFGARAALCGACAAAAKRDELASAGYVSISYDELRDIRGVVDAESVFIDGAYLALVPRWIVALRGLLAVAEVVPRGPLVRARDDAEFRAAFLALGDLLRFEGVADVRAPLREFLRAHDVLEIADGA